MISPRLQKKQAHPLRLGRSILDLALGAANFCRGEAPTAPTWVFKVF
jgi:hypothetical protein